MIGGISTTQTRSTNLTGAASGPGGAMGKDEFLQLLVAQLQNQDPLSPMKGEEFAAQLAQFSTVEQLVGIHEQLKDQAALQTAAIQASAASSAVEIVGKDVLATGSRLVIREGEPVQITVGAAAAGDAELRILDSTGRQVASGPVGRVSTGRNIIEPGALAADLPPGDYRYELTVTGPDGGSVSVQSFTRVRIEAVRFGVQGPVLLAGDGLEIPLSTVVEVRRPDQG
jgi:flagellar basal-body rod modification protein FlgD